MNYSLEIFADYHQFYLMDDEEQPDYPSEITELDCSNMAKIAPYIIAVYTTRNTTVPVNVRISNSDPGINFDLWDHIVECSIAVPSGRLVVLGCTDYLPEAQRLEMLSGTYQARICYGNLDTISVNCLDGTDHYTVDLWQGQMQKLQVIKQWENAPYL